MVIPMDHGPGGAAFATDGRGAAPAGLACGSQARPISLVAVTPLAPRIRRHPRWAPPGRAAVGRCPSEPRLPSWSVVSAAPFRAAARPTACHGAGLTSTGRCRACQARRGGCVRCQWLHVRRHRDCSRAVLVASGQRSPLAGPSGLQGGWPGGVAGSHPPCRRSAPTAHGSAAGHGPPSPLVVPPAAAYRPHPLRPRRPHLRLGERRGPGGDSGPGQLDAGPVPYRDGEGGPARDTHLRGERPAAAVALKRSGARAVAVVVIGRHVPPPGPGQ
jgi:hypothetical protein